MELADDDHHLANRPPALRMGNTVVVKPSGYTPLSVSALVAIANTVLPKDVSPIVTPVMVGLVQLTTHPDVDKIMFTGSTETGKENHRGFCQQHHPPGPWSLAVTMLP